MEGRREEAHSRGASSRCGRAGTRKVTAMPVRASLSLHPAPLHYHHILLRALRRRRRLTNGSVGPRVTRNKFMPQDSGYRCRSLPSVFREPNEFILVAVTVVRNLGSLETSPASGHKVVVAFKSSRKFRSNETSTVVESVACGHCFNGNTGAPCRSAVSGPR